MTGAVLLTGANGSLGIPAVEYLLKTYSDFTAILAVRDDTDSDQNTVKLRHVISRYPNASASIRKLDLGSLKEVETFSSVLRHDIKDGKIPRLVAIICNAMAWKLSGGPGFTSDGLESTLAINHLAHFTVVLRLLDSMDAQRGRIIFLGSQSHWPEKAGLSRGFPTRLPEDLDQLVHPEHDPEGEERGRGFRRYGVSKLVITMVMYEMNRRLHQNIDTRSIRAITIDPGDLLNSTTFFRPHVPKSLQYMFMVGSWLLPLVRLLQPRITKVEEAAKPVIDIAVADTYAGQEGYFESSVKQDSSPHSLEEEMQKTLWEKSVAWCGLVQEDTVVEL